MRPARRVLAGLCAGVLALGASAAFAQSDRPHKRPTPPPASKPVETGNATGDADAAVPATSSPATSRPNVTVRSPTPAPSPVLRSAVQSRWSRPATIAHGSAGQCRAVCAEQRLSCANGQGDVSGCDPAWSQCLSACGGLTYSRGP